MKVTGKSGWMVVLLLAAAASVSACGPKGKPYVYSEQTPASYITEQRSQADVVRHDDRACAFTVPEDGGAYPYLDALLECGERRSGTATYRCAAAFAREALKTMGYQVEELEYGFPYYEYDLADFSLTRQPDGREYRAHPMHYSAPIAAPLIGKVVRPKKDLSGCFVYVNPEEPGAGPLGPRLETWRDRGAVGVIREATMKPLSGRGLLHAAGAHRTSWYYAPLPALVVEKAHSLLGSTIEVRGQSRIARGTGIDVVAKSPAPAESYVVITAHLDSWFQGALDDGSGSAALLEVARLLSDDPSGLIFLLADTEEVGLIGSAVFAQNFDLNRVAAVIELDMVSTKNNYGFFTSPGRAPNMPRFITYTGGGRPATVEHLRQLHGPDLFVPMGGAIGLLGSLATDMEWFYSHGAPGAFIYTPSKFYHTGRDTLEWIDPQDLQDVAVAVAELATSYRAAPPPRPDEIIPFNFNARPADAGEVELTVEPGAELKSASVLCYFEMGYEERLELTRDGDVWRALHAPSRPGLWQYLAVASQGKKFGKRWATLEVK